MGGIAWFGAVDVSISMYYRELSRAYCGARTGGSMILNHSKNIYLEISIY